MKSIVIQSRIPQDIYKQFKAICKKKKITMSHVIRNLILENIVAYLDSEATKGK